MFIVVMFDGCGIKLYDEIVPTLQKAEEVMNTHGFSHDGEKWVCTHNSFGLVGDSEYYRGFHAHVITLCQPDILRTIKKMENQHLIRSFIKIKETIEL